METGICASKYRRGVLIAALVCVLTILPAVSFSCQGQAAAPAPGITYDLPQGMEITSIRLYVSDDKLLWVDLQVKNTGASPAAFVVMAKADDASPVGSDVPPDRGTVASGNSTTVKIQTLHKGVMPNRLEIRGELLQR